ncbi:MAG TPA: TonB-dependent receptor plug domain-containing protein [Gemmatimonadales bacterium]|nr:TonB-dependent receptor plug domain-containing protein [Gemmatimonadales bacterium]
MKSSLFLGTLLPTGLALAMTIGCAHANTKSTVRPALKSATLTAEDIDRAPGVAIEQLLAARVPGLTLTQTRDGQIVMHLRGQNTLIGEQQPLFVVNGVPLGNAANFSALNRYDIASILVVRDAAGMAFYGIRGANGVIIVRTKSRF